MQYMVIENYKPGKSRDVYQRFLDKGRMLPEGLIYISSWVNNDFSICYQLMQTDHADLFSTWIRSWSDLVDFTIVPLAEPGAWRSALGFPD